MNEPTTLEEAIQIIKSMKRCGICKHYAMSFVGTPKLPLHFCDKEYADKDGKKACYECIKEAHESCEHWE